MDEVFVFLFLLTHFFADGVAVFFFSLLTHFFTDSVAVSSSMSSQQQLLLFFSCRPSDRFTLFISELQAQAGIVDPIDGFFFFFVLTCFTASFKAQTVFVDPIDGLLCSFLRID